MKPSSGEARSARWHGFVTHLKPRESELTLRQITVALKGCWPQMPQNHQVLEFWGPPKTVKIHAALARFWLGIAGFEAARPGDGAPAFRDVELDSRNLC